MSYNIVGVLDAAVNRGATDVILKCGGPPKISVNTDLFALPNTAALQAADVEQVLKSVVPEENQIELAKFRDTDFSFALTIDNKPKARFRANAFYAQGHPAFAFRRLPYQILTHEQIGLSPQFLSLALMDQGLILVTGATGSGKTTTLAASILYIAKRRRGHILMLEQPTEYRLSDDGLPSTITQREIPGDCPDFLRGIRASLRQRPNVIVVGEMRDEETMQAAITAAQTGHLVLATLHTKGAQETVERVIDVFDTAKQNKIRSDLAQNLLGVLSQKILPRVDRDGLVAAFEFMVVTPSIRNLIRSGRTDRIVNDMQTGRALGMHLMDDSLFELVQSGAVDPDRAIRKANDPDTFARRLGKA